VCPEDRRGAFAVLTQEGRELMDRAIPDHIAHVNELLSSVFTVEEEENLAGLLRTLRDHLMSLNSGFECQEVSGGGLCSEE
jgi:DNA-binding MarR family transcriptional regulator